MKRLIYLFTLVLLLVSCKSPIQKYFLVSENDYLKSDEQANAKAFILLTQNELSSDAILSESYNRFKTNNKSVIKKYLDSLEKIDSRNPSFLFAKASYLISDLEYEKALNALKVIKDSKYRNLIEILVIDMENEIAKQNDGYEAKVFITKYQTLLDKFSDNENLKAIINLRVRLIRYNY